MLKFTATQIYSFTFKCASCDNEIIIKTDPQNNTYDYAQGIRAMEQDFTPEFGDSLIEAVSDEVKNKLQNDPMYQLQHEKEDKEKARSAKDRIASLVDLSEATTRQDYDINSALRRKNRSQRKRSAELMEEGKRHGLSIPLVEPNEEDATQAKLAMDSHKKNRGHRSTFATNERVKKTKILSSGIFDKPSSSSRSSASKPFGQVSATRVSSASRSHGVHITAMQKAAERNIRVKNMRIVDNEDIKLLPTSETNIRKSHHTKKETNKRNVPTIKDEKQMTNVGALTMLSMYGDCDDSS